MAMTTMGPDFNRKRMALRTTLTIELRLRDIKTTLDFEMLAVKGPAMARKTLAMIRIAYNLMRVLMQRAAREAGETVGNISFKGGSGPDHLDPRILPGLRGQARRRADELRFLTEMMATRLIDHRPFRREPRAVKRRP